MTTSRTAEPPAPQRFRVGFKRPEALLQEFTRSVGRGSASLEAKRQVATGTRFVFELFAAGVSEPVEVEAEVVACRPSPRGTWLLHVSYRPGRRGALDKLIYLVFDAQRLERIRKYPRVPLNARATEDEPYSPSYLIRDVSLGGMGVIVEANDLPKRAQVGAPFLAELSLGSGTLALRGVVVWAFDPPPAMRRLCPAFGVQFVEDLQLEALELLDEVVSLKALPRRSRISFGEDAFASP